MNIFWWIFFSACLVAVIALGVIQYRRIDAWAKRELAEVEERHKRGREDLRKRADATRKQVTK